MVPSVAVGYREFDVTFTDRRIVAARIGTVSDASIVGIAGYVAMKRLPPDVPKNLRNRYDGLSLEEVLGVDEANFEIPYGKVRRAVLHASRHEVSLGVDALMGAVERKDKFQWAPKRSGGQALLGEITDILRRYLGARLQQG